MPDDRIAISGLTEVTTLDNDDLLPVVHTLSGVDTTMKAKMTTVGTKVNKEMQFASDLQTTNKTIIGAINEIAQGGGGASALADLTDVTITNPSNGQVITYNAQTGKWVNGAGAEITLTNTFSATPIATLTDGAENVPMKSLVVNIEPQQASGTPTPSSPLPISGFTGANVTHTGKNLAKPFAFTYSGSGIDANYSNNSVTLSGTASANVNVPVSSWVRDNNAFMTLEAGTYTATISQAVTGVSIQAVNANSGGGLGSGATSVTFTLNQTTNVYLRVVVASGTAITQAVTIGISLTKGSDTTYYPYTGTTYPISWQTEAGTVYGGWYDVTTGKLVITYKAINLDDDSITWEYRSEQKVFRSTAISDLKAPSGTQQIPAWFCEIFSIESSTHVYNSAESYDNTLGCASTGRLYISYQTAQGDLTTFTTAVSGKKLVYELATPIEYNLTPTTIKTQGGTESIFADCGEVEGEYFNLIADDVASLVNLILDSRQTILTDTLEAGETEITFTSDKITTDSMIDIYTSPVGINYSAIAVSSGEVVITFAEQASDIGVKAVIK